MIQVRLLAAWKNLVHDDRVAQCDATVRQTPHVFSDSPGMLFQTSIDKEHNVIAYLKIVYCISLCNLQG